MQKSVSYATPTCLNIIFTVFYSLRSLWEGDDANLGRRDSGRTHQYLHRFLLYLSWPPAPSSSPIHRKPLCNFALAARLSVSQSWQTSLHSRSQNMDESVLGKWQGRRPLPAWSLDQGSPYPAIYPLWTRGGGAGGEMMRQMTGEMKLSIKCQLKKKKKKTGRKMPLDRLDNRENSFISHMHFSTTKSSLPLD